MAPVVAEASTPSFTVFVGYADNLRPSPFFPSPWSGSSNVNFIGTGPSYDAGAIEVKNNTSQAFTVDSAAVDIGTPTTTSGAPPCPCRPAAA